MTLALTSNTGISRESVQKVVSCVHRAGIIELQQRFYHGRDSYATEESKLIWPLCTIGDWDDVNKYEFFYLFFFLAPDPNIGDSISTNTWMQFLYKRVYNYGVCWHMFVSGDFTHDFIHNVSTVLCPSWMAYFFRTCKIWNGWHLLRLPECYDLWHNMESFKSWLFSRPFYLRLLCLNIVIFKCWKVFSSEE